MSRDIHLDVDGMTCGHCQAAVQKALDAVPGVSEVAVNLEEGRAKARASDDVSVEALIEAVTGAGYTAAQEGS